MMLFIALLLASPVNALRQGQDGCTGATSPACDDPRFGAGPNDGCVAPIEVQCPINKENCCKTKEFANVGGYTCYEDDYKSAEGGFLGSGSGKLLRARPYYERALFIAADSARCAPPRMLSASQRRDAPRLAR